MKKSWYLFLKQGIKGVLRFKIQFIVIIILSFLATLILTVSVTTSQRLTNDYNQTMDKMDKFDYVQQKTVGVRSNGEREISIVPITDFVNDQFLRVIDSLNPDSPQSNYGIEHNINLVNFFNEENKDFNLNNEELNLYNETYYDTFITRTFNDPEIQDAFIDLLVSPDYYQSFFDYSYDPLTEKVNYNPKGINIKNTNQVLSGYLDGRASLSLEHFFKKVLKKFKIKLIKDIQNFLDNPGEDNYLKTTPYANMVLNEKIDIKNDLEPIFYESNLNNKYNTYLYSALETILFQINYMVYEYVTYYTNQVVNANYETNRPKTRTEIAKIFNDDKSGITNEAGFKWLEFDDNPIESLPIEQPSVLNPNNNELEFAFTLFTYIYGIEYNGKKYTDKYSTFKPNSSNTKYKDMLVTDSNLPWIQVVDKNPNSKINYKGKVIENKTDLFKYGAKGSFSQIITSLNDGKINGPIFQSTNLKYLKHEVQSESLINQLGYKSDFSMLTNRREIDYDNFESRKIYTLRHEIIAEASNLDYQVRGEVLLADNATETKYRVVNLDYYWEEKLTLYEGHMPRTNNEILINPQYAKANNYKLGSNITVGGSDFVISGFASDPLTYYPVSELTVPIPNNKTSAVIYTYHDVIKQKIVTNDHSKYATNYFYNILTSKDNNVDQNMALFAAYSFNNPWELQGNKKNLDKYFIYNQEIAYNNVLRAEKYSSFDDSPLSLNWKLTPLILNSFKTFTYIACSIISLISLAAIIIAIKKTIEMNSKEIATLKSMGAKSNEISISYISYGIITMIFIIPIAWILGSFIQELISMMLLRYMGGSHSLLLFNIWPFIISMVIFGIVSCIVSYLVALFLNKKSVLEIFSKKENIKRIEWLDNLKFKITKNAKFSTRFSGELAVSGFSKTLLTGTVIFVAGFLITSGLAVPGMVDNFVSSYYKNINYSNDIKNIEPYGNAPFAKTALSPWQGPDYYEQYMIETNNYFGTGINEVSQSVTNTSGIGDTSVVSKIFLCQQNNNPSIIEASWSYDILHSKQSKKNNCNDNQHIDLIAALGSIIGNNMTQVIGKGINMAEVQRLLEWTIHDATYIDEQKRIEDVNKISNVLTEGLPPILAQFFSGNLSGEGSWKEQILDLFLSETPSYIKNYVTLSENRLNQFQFGWTFYNYVPSVDNMYTQINSYNDKTDLKLIGIQENQTAFNIKNNKLFLGEQIAQDIYKILYGKIEPDDDILINNFKVYDKKNKTLNIPAAMNKQAQMDKVFLNNKFENMLFKAPRMLLGNINIPNTAWMYDDRDWSIIKDESIDDLETYWIPAHKIQQSKLTHAPIYDYQNSTGFNRTLKTNQLLDNSYGFINLTQTIDNNGEIIITPEIRPYYLYDNVTLFVPEELDSKLEEIKNMGNSNSENWYGKIENGTKVPKDTIIGWEKELNKQLTDTDFIWIKPYSLEFDPRGGDNPYKKPDKNLSGKELELLSLSYSNFLYQSFKHHDGPFKLENAQLDWSNLSKTKNNISNVEKINIIKVSNLDIYGNSLIIIDQDIANIVHGFEIDKYIPFNYIYEDLSKSAYTYNANGIEISTYNKTNPKNLIHKDNQQNWIYGKNDLQKSVKPNMWFNGVYSNYEEPIAITTQASFSQVPKIGEDTLGASANFNWGVEIENIQFLSQQQSLVNQISALILTLASIFISLIIIISILTITLITDLYVNQYKKFMLVMKSLGYSNKKILYYTFSFISIFSLITYSIGVGISYLTIFGIVTYINNTIGVIPFGLTWWSPILGTLLVIIVYLSSISITTKRIRTESPTKLLS